MREESQIDLEEYWQQECGASYFKNKRKKGDYEIEEIYRVQSTADRLPFNAQIPKQPGQSFIKNTIKSDKFDIS